MPFSATQRSMQSNRGKDTKPEMIVRRLLHALGYRYRLHRKELPGRPDLVFPSRRKIIFVHGCYWHQHGCQRSSVTPKTNEIFWQNKFSRNVERDATNIQRLASLGWTSLVVWECELKDRDALRLMLEDFLRSD